MTSSEVDQKLERLFSVAREATLPEVGAKARIRAALAPRLANGGSTPSAVKRRAWLGLGLGAVVIGIGAGALWLTNAPRVVVEQPAPIISARLPESLARVSAALAPDVTLPPASSVELPSPKPHVIPSSAVSKPAPSVVSEDPAEELTLVRAMQRALRAGDVSQALGLAAEHAQRFPRGTLLEEREGVRAVARCRLAGPAERVSIGDAFTRRFGSSPYGARVKQACQ